MTRLASDTSAPVFCWLPSARSTTSGVGSGDDLIRCFATKAESTNMPVAPLSSNSTALLPAMVPRSLKSRRGIALMWAINDWYSRQRSGWRSFDDEGDDTISDTEGWRLHDAAASAISDELAGLPSVSTSEPLGSVAVAMFAVDDATGLTILTASQPCRSPVRDGRSPCT